MPSLKASLIYETYEKSSFNLWVCYLHNVNVSDGLYFPERLEQLALVHLAPPLDTMFFGQ